MSVERAYEEAAYITALMVYLIEHKTDKEADEEIAGLLHDKPYWLGVVIGVMEAW
jgi:hypothetical protein